MIVLSLFDGMSCGRLALERAGIRIDKYYASEIDPHAIKVAQANYPDTVRLGDVTKWRKWDVDWSKVDLILAGSPCQGFSMAGKQLAFDDPRSALFFTYVDILRHVQSLNPDVKFLLENVKMKKDYLDVISNYLGTQPVFINSALVSAHNRQRYYWANWEFGQPEDSGALLGEILESGHVDREKSYCIDANYHKGGNITQYFQKSRRQLVFTCPGSYKEFRKLTPIECERLQTVPDGYTDHVSNTQRYRMLGNGWTVDVIAHILRGMEGTK